jgi:hypothetical protein
MDAPQNQETIEVQRGGGNTLGEPRRTQPQMSSLEFGTDQIIPAALETALMHMILGSAHNLLGIYYHTASS